MSDKKWWSGTHNREMQVRYFWICLNILPVLQINSVSPVFDLQGRFGDKHVSDRIQQ